MKISSVFTFFISISQESNIFYCISLNIFLLMLKIFIPLHTDSQQNVSLFKKKNYEKVIFSRSHDGCFFGSKCTSVCLWIIGIPIN